MAEAVAARDGEAIGPDPYSSEPPLTPQMSAVEVTRLRDAFSRSRVGLEFGMGGSTLLAAKCGLEFYYSVESDREWVDRCACDPTLEPLVQAGRWHLRFIDIGRTKRWGKPADKSAKSRWPDYHSLIWSELRHTPDIVLIDGRFRVACALQVARHCPVGTMVLMHDYPRRTPYHSVERFLQPTELVDTLQVFSLARRPDADELDAALSAAQFHPG